MLSFPIRAARKLGRVTRRSAKVLTSPTRVAIIGCGTICSTHIQSFEATRRTIVVAVSDLRSEPLAGILDQWPFLKGYISCQQMLEEVRPDLVSICTWPQHHAELVVACARHGVKAILCEKPIALRLDEIDRMLDECNARGVKLACGHQYRFHPLFQRASELIASGRLGNILRASGSIRGSLANNGPHLIDSIRFLLADRPIVRVQAQCVREGELEERGLPCETAARTILEFDGQIDCKLETGVADAAAFRVAVQGTAGDLVVTPTTLTVSGSAPVTDKMANIVCRGRQFAELGDWVRGKRDCYAATGFSARATAEGVLAAYESIRTAQPIELPLANCGDVIAETFPSWQPQKDGVSLVATSTARYPRLLAMAGGQREMPQWFSSDPILGLPEAKNLLKVVLSRQLNSVGGQMVKRLEREFAATYKAGSAVASTSGTAAIHVALGALNLEPCDEVITTPLTDMGSVIPILACNCIPVFADIDPVSGNLTAETVLRKITSRTRAVILVHLFGRPADLGPLVDLLQLKGIALIEDCSQAHFAEYRGQKVGTFGDFGCFSLQQSKQITCGDGGVTLVNRPELHESAALYVDKGWRRGQDKTGHLRLGMNYRMTELQAAVAVAQLGRLPELVECRRRTADDLTRQLSDVPCIVLPPHDHHIRSSWWKFLFRFMETPGGMQANDFFDAVRLEGVRLKRSYLERPIFEEPVLKVPNTYGHSGYPFSATQYRPPQLEEFPGFLEFNSSWFQIGWSSRILPRHVTQISRAIHKVAKQQQLDRVAYQAAARSSLGFQPTHSTPS